MCSVCRVATYDCHFVQCTQLQRWCFVLAPGKGRETMYIWCSSGEVANPTSAVCVLTWASVSRECHYSNCLPNYCTEMARLLTDLQKIQREKYVEVYA